MFFWPLCNGMPFTLLLVNRKTYIGTQNNQNTTIWKSFFALISSPFLMNCLRCLRRWCFLQPSLQRYIQAYLVHSLLTCSNNHNYQRIQKCFPCKLFHYSVELAQQRKHKRNSYWNRKKYISDFMVPDISTM